MATGSQRIVKGPSPPVPGDASTDEELLRAVATGSKEAMAHLYDRHSPSLLALANSILRAQGDAEDLLHDVFLQVWQEPHSFDPGRGSVLSWLRWRLRCRAVDRVRRLAMARRYDVAKSIADTQPDSNSELGRAPDQAKARAAVAKLSEPLAKVATLVHLRGFTCREAASHLGIPLGTVKSRLAAAMARLRRILS